MRAKNTMLTALVLVITSTGTTLPVELNRSVFDRELSRIKYQNSFAWSAQDQPDTGRAAISLSRQASSDRPRLKSPGRAFLYSLAVPGLGQFYYGSKIKPLIFLSAEIAAWAMYFKWDSDADDLTGAYQEFNRTHWSRDAYQTQLLWTYGEADDNDIDSTEITHHLPDTRTQQYYEMTGKYDQFAWGWDDATLNGNTLNDYDSAQPPPRVGVTPGSVPDSPNRLTYEQMRDDANSRYDRANRMIFVSIANRLISAFEAYFVVKSRNNKIKKRTWGVERFKVRTGLKSFQSHWDTPYVKLSYVF